MSTQEANTLISTRKPSRWKDPLRRLCYPEEHCELPELAEGKDVLVCRTISRLNFWGRLLIFFSGRICTESRTVTENTIGKQNTSIVSFILPPKWLEREDQ